MRVSYAGRWLAVAMAILLTGGWAGSVGAAWGSTGFVHLAQYYRYPPPGHYPPSAPYYHPPPCDVAGGALRGAGRGAAGGAIFGAIGGSAGAGAAIGAMIGGLAGASRRATAQSYGYCR